MRLRPFSISVPTVALLAALVGCGVEGDPASPPDGGSEDAGRPWARMSLSPQSVTVDAIGGIVQFRAAVVDPRGYTISGVTIEWVSLDPTIAVVSRPGEMQVLEAGVARLVASSGPVSDTAVVTVDTMFSATTCTSCHGSAPGSHARWSVAPGSCAACHQGVDAPVHGSSARDHRTVAGFDLLGAHDTLGCDGCHDARTGQTSSGPVGQSACFSCHAADYQAQHGGNGYPTDCLACHTTDTWKGATPLDHDGQFFPIFSGKHAGKWTDCATCHTDPARFSEFTCFNCHKHDQSSMDNEHQGRSGYLYDSQACLRCHPDGKE